VQLVEQGDEEANEHRLQLEEHLHRSNAELAQLKTRMEKMSQACERSVRTCEDGKQFIELFKRDHRELSQRVGAAERKLEACPNLEHVPAACPHEDDHIPQSSSRATTPRSSHGSATPRALTPRGGAIVPVERTHELETKIMTLERHFEDLEAQTLDRQDEAAVSAKQLVTTLGLVKDLREELGERFKAEVVNQVSEAVIQRFEDKLVALKSSPGDVQRMDMIESSNKQLEKQFKTIQSTVRRATKDLVAVSVKDIKSEVMQESTKLIEEFRKKHRADGHSERKFAEFEDKLIGRVTEIVATVGTSAQHDETSILSERLATLESWGTPQVKQVNTLIDRLELLNSRVSKVENHKEEYDTELGLLHEMEQQVQAQVGRVDQLDSQLKVLIVGPGNATKHGKGHSSEASGELGHRVETLEHDVFVKLQVAMAQEQENGSKVQEALLEVNERMNEIVDDFQESLAAVIDKVEMLEQDQR